MIRRKQSVVITVHGLDSKLQTRGGLSGTNAPAYSVSPSVTKKKKFYEISTSSSSSSASEVRAPPCPEDGGGDLMTSRYVNFFVADKLDRLYYERNFSLG